MSVSSCAWSNTCAPIKAVLLLNSNIFRVGESHKRSVKYMAAIFVVLPIVLLVSAVVYGSEPQTGQIVTSRFDRKDLSGWLEKDFAGRTDYSFIEDEEKGWVLKAYSNGTASGLVKKARVEISKTPYLNWSWKVGFLPKVKDEKTRKGDDYPARIYVIFKTGPWFWVKRAVNYVWSSNYIVGETWPNAFTSNTCIIVAQSGSKEVGRWVEEKHNVKDDINECFGIAVETIEAVALMSDSDNSKKEALAYYSEIYFTEN